MVSEEELLSVLKSTLQENGDLGRLKADLTTQVMRTLRIDSQLADTDTTRSKPQPPPTVLLANHLIRDYLAWAGLTFTQMIFTSEASLPVESPSRAELCRELHVQDAPSTRQLPLLLSLLAAVKELTPPSPSPQHT